MPWSKSTQTVPEIDSIEDCTSIMEGELVVLFKHSPTCPVSWMAHREVLQYQSLQSGVPVYLISVRRRRDVSRYIADQTGIQHESPQVIVLRKGDVVASASHDAITAEAISAFVESDPPQDASGLEPIASPERMQNPGS